MWLKYCGNSKPCRSSRGSLLPKLLSTLFWPRKPPFGNLHRRVKLKGSVALHRVGNVAVQVKRDPHRRVTESLRSDLRMHATGEQLSRVAVPQVMEPDAGHILH